MCITFSKLTYIFMNKIYANFENCTPIYMYLLDVIFICTLYPPEVVGRGSETRLQVENFF